VGLKAKKLSDDLIAMLGRAAFEALPQQLLGQAAVTRKLSDGAAAFANFGFDILRMPIAPVSLAYTCHVDRHNDK